MIAEGAVPFTLSFCSAIVHAHYTYYIPPEYFSVSGRRAITNQFAPEVFLACPCNKENLTLIGYVYTAPWKIRPVKVHQRPQSYSCPLKRFARIL